ncbi:hypothetical protein RJD38_10935 [Vibrio scophthalmi]|uniref:hypothetical protein n=1 Tax=Vibrio scophthalmi TaxID=45658 RepID=UPI00349F8F7F
MKESTASKDILLAMRKIMLCQLTFGLFAVAFEVLSSFHRELNIESALIGVFLAIIPGMFGMFVASRKAKYRPNAEESPNDFDKNHKFKVDAHLVM